MNAKNTLLIVPAIYHGCKQGEEEEGLQHTVLLLADMAYRTVFYDD